MFKDTEFWDTLAIQSYKSLLKNQPSASFLHKNLALAYIRIKKPNKAIRSLMRAIKCDKENTEAYYHLAMLYYNQEDFKQATTYFKHYKKLMVKNNDPISSKIEVIIRNAQDELSYNT